MQAAEAATVDEGSKHAIEIFKALQRAGAANPLHQRLDDALDPSRALPLIPDSREIEQEALAEVGAFDIEKAKKLYDIPVEMQPLVAEYIRFFQTVGRKHFVKWLERSSRYLPMMRQTLKESGLPEDTVYLSMIESGFSPLAYSRARASGMWQFIEATGRRYGLASDFWLDQRRDPIKATAAAAQYLKELYAEFGDWRLAWASYNAGENRVRFAVKDRKTTDFWEMSKSRVFRKETRHYVPKLMAAALICKHLKAFGFSEAEFSPLKPLEFEEAEVPEFTDLDVIARSAGTTVEELQELNPELRRWCTPPASKGNENYRIRLPVGTKDRFAENFSKLAPRERLTFRVHHVTRGDTLSKIAARYGSASEAIMRINGIRDSRKLKLNMDLVIPVARSSGSKEALAAQARKKGFNPAPAAEEIPAEPPARKPQAPTGVVKKTVENGKVKIVYGVANGDSLWTIARKFDVTVDKIVSWNSLSSRTVSLKVGQELTLWPDESKASGSSKPPADAKANGHQGRHRSTKGASARAN